MSGTPNPATPQGASAEVVVERTAADAEVQVFFGEATESGCRIYAENQRPDAAPLSGFIRGPFCQYAHTLPVTYAFRTRPGTAAGMLEAWVPDPCFWTPGMPFQYQYTLERDADGRREQIAGALGIRRLGCDGSNLRFDGKRWVLRGAIAGTLSGADLATWHAASMAAIVRWPGDVPLVEASRRGVLLVIELATDANVERELRTLRDAAAVAVVILPGDPVGADLRRLARNLLFGQRCAPGEAPEVADWADVAICELRSEEVSGDQSGVVGRNVPLIALRRSAGENSPQRDRALCDALQRDLAESGVNWVGYVV